MKLHQINEPNTSDNEIDDFYNFNISNIAIGIDLGTTNSLISFYDKIKKKIIQIPMEENTSIEEKENIHGIKINSKTNEKSNIKINYLLPSIVDYSLNSNIFYDKNAPHTIKAIIGNTPQTTNEHQNNTFRSIKRFMGKGLSDISTMENDIKNYGLEIDYDNSSDSSLKFKHKKTNQSYTAIEISSEILKVLVQKANIYLSEYFNQKINIKNAVITVPAHFDEAARIATRHAARLININILRLLNEPTAAAIAYGFNPNDKGIESNSNNIDNKNTKKNPVLVYDLGGGTFDVSILKIFNGVFKVISTGGDNHIGGDDFDNLMLELLHEKKYHGLTIMNHVEQIKFAKKIKEVISDGDIELNNNNSQNNISITLKDFELKCEQLIKKMNNITTSVLKDAKINDYNNITIILVGGATRMPMIINNLKATFNNNEILCNLNPDYVVANGAAIQAFALTQESNHLLLDVVPLSLGIEIMGDIVDPIIYRNTTIPTEIKKKYTTYINNQKTFKIHILQGESKNIKECRSLGIFNLTNITPKPAGEALLEITFRIDADGLLTVSAEEVGKNNSIHIEIKPSYGLSEEELIKLLK